MSGKDASENRSSTLELAVAGRKPVGVHARSIL